MPTQTCYQHHPMSISPMDLQPQICFICTSRFMPNYQTLTCIPCQISLCLDCVLTYTPETAFPMHLACNAESSMLKQYQVDRSCATHLYRDPYKIAVYHEYQRFYNTDEYVKLLEERVENEEHEISCITQELKNTQNRMASTKYELMNARQKKKLAAVQENPHKETQ